MRGTNIGKSNPTPCEGHIAKTIWQQRVYKYTKMGWNFAFPTQLLFLSAFFKKNFRVSSYLSVFFGNEDFSKRKITATVGF